MLDALLIMNYCEILKSLHNSRYDAAISDAAISTRRRYFDAVIYNAHNLAVAII